MFDRRGFLDWSVTLQGLADAYFCVSLWIVGVLLALLPLAVAQVI